MPCFSFTEMADVVFDADENDEGEEMRWQLNDLKY